MALRFRDFVASLKREVDHSPETQTVLVLSPPVEDTPGTYETLVTLRNVSDKRREDYVRVEAYDGESWHHAVTGWKMYSLPGEVRQCWFAIEMDIEPVAFRVALSDRTVDVEIEDENGA